MAERKTDMVPREKVVKASLVTLAIGLLLGGYLGASIMAMVQADRLVAAQAQQVQTPPPGQMPPGSQPGQSMSPDEMTRIKTLMAVVDADPSDAGAWVQLGNAYFDANQPAKSVEAYARSLELAPGNPNVLTDMGVMYRRLGKPDMAVESFDRAIAADPEHPTARFNKGVVLMHDLDDVEGALDAWRELVEIHPDAKAPDGTPVSVLIKEIAGE